jgi:PAS domain S-box-containing protein
MVVLDRVRSWFRAPDYGNEDQNRVARLLAMVLRTFIVASIVLSLLSFIVGYTKSALVLLAGLGILLINSWFLRKGYLAYSTWLILALLVLLNTYLAFIGDGIHDVALIAFPLIFIVAGLLGNGRTVVISTGFVLGCISFLAYSEVTGYIPSPYSVSKILIDYLFYILILLVIMACVVALTRYLQRSIFDARHNRQELEGVLRRLAKQADELKASEARWRSLVENTPALVMNIDQQGVVQFINDPYAFSEVVSGDTILDVLSPGQAKDLRGLVDGVFTTGEKAHFDIAWFTPQNRHLWLAVYLGPVRQDGAVTSIMLVAIDITERKQAEEEAQHLASELEQRVQQRTAELEAKAQELEMFAYSISHDLKAPLRGIEGYSQLLLEEHVNTLHADGQHFVKSIRRAALHMNQLIDDLLIYARFERRKISKGAMDLKALVHSVLDEHNAEITARNVEVTVNLDCETIFADAEAYHLTLRHLVENALKFTRDVSDPRLEIGGRDSGAGSLVWIKDNGIGFDMRYHDRIFELFQRLHRVEEYPGTGVGLALVRKVIRRMGGRVWAESQPDQGATFFVEVPA